VVTVTDDTDTLREQSRDWCHIGTFDFKLLPHHLDAFGPRIMFLIKGTPVFCMDSRSSHVLTPGQARLMANRLKIAADEAEAMQRRMQRTKRAADEIPTTTTMEK
jgi:hypothetical protein